MKNRIKQVGALVLAAALIFSAFSLPKAYAALGVDVNAKCSVEIDVTQTGMSELMNLPVEVHLYKVADIDAQGEYTAIGDFRQLDFSGVDSNTTAEDWETLANEAKALVRPTTEKAAVITLVNGKGTATGLSTGMYLVDAQQALSDSYQYDFNPYLISLPNNNYYSTGNDEWIYNLTGSNAIGLKPEKTDRFGDLVINKTLDAYNATIGGATFVFQVEAFKTDPDTNERKCVYSNVVSVTFDGVGTESILIEDIPAGAEVVVTEIYSGASYTLTSDGSYTVTIIADGEEGAPATVDFSNTYNYEFNGGNGIVNSFLYDSETDSWTHIATEDSTQ